MTVPAKGFTADQQAFLSIAQKHGIDINDPTQVAGVLFMSQGATTQADFEKTLSQLDQVAGKGTLTKIINDLATGQNTVTASGFIISMAKSIAKIDIPAGT